MPKVICTLENAADEISGVKFAAHEEGTKISEEISAEKAEMFASIPGYEVATDAAKAPAAKAPASAKPVKKAAAPEPVVDPAVTATVAVEDAAGPGAAVSDDETAF